MKKDEIINKYIDGEISDFELKELNLLIDKDPFILEEIKTIKLLESKFRQIKIDEAPAGFTDKLMNTVLKAKSNNIDKFYFAVILLFTVMIMGIIIYLSTFVTSTESGSSFASKSVYWINNINFDKVTRYFKNSDFVLVSSMLSILILISSYFIQQNFRNFKRIINSAEHK